MDSDIYRASSSMRTNCSSIWRNNVNEVFSRSSHEEDDEEALKWASLEKLPTFDRLKKGLLLGSMGAPAMQVEIEDLSPQERLKLMERLVKVAEEDNEKFLLKLRDRIDRVGIDLPTAEVRYEHLSVDAEAFVGGRSLPTFLNFYTNLIEMLLNKLNILSTKKKQVSILHDVSGIIKPLR